MLAEVADEGGQEPRSLPQATGRHVEPNAQFRETMAGHVLQLGPLQLVPEELGGVEVGNRPGLEARWAHGFENTAPSSRSTDATTGLFT